jgi:hypothetical protein
LQQAVHTQKTMFARAVGRVPVRRMSVIPKLRHNDFAIVFDVDGVLIKGSKVLPQAKKVLDYLKLHE